MVSVQTFTLPHYLAYPVHVGLFTHVANAAFLRSQLLDANPDFDYAFLDASMVGPCFISSTLLFFLPLFPTAPPRLIFAMPQMVEMSRTRRCPRYSVT